MEDGRKVLIESLAWDKLLPHLNQLPMAAVEGVVNGRTAIALQRMVPKLGSVLKTLKPLEIAAADYNPRGYVIDFLVVPDETSNNIFITGETYVVWGSYYASSATFQPGCIIKNYSLGRIVLTGSFSFPDTLQSCVFTSIDDDTFGERIFGKTNLIRNSDGDPSTDRPNSLLQVSSLYATTEVRNCLFRWGVYGLAYFQTAASSSHTVRDCRFENFQSASGSIAALHISIPSSSTVSLVSSDMANVDVQKYDPSSRVTGTLSLANFYTDKRFAGQNWLGWRSLTPDCMGAAGPNHFVQIINDWIRVYTKNGAIVTGNDMTMSYFFLRYSPVDASDVRMIDPRIIYDFQSQAWAALALDRQKNNPTLDIVLAIKNSTDPTSLTSWTRHTIPTANSTWTTDWPTLATDKHGLYITAPRVGERDANGYDVVHDHVVIGAKKPGVFTSQPLTYNTLTVASTDIYAIQPAHNYDDPPVQNYVWFIAKKFPTGTGPNYQPGQIVYRRAYWLGNGQLTFFDSNWVNLPNCSPAQAKYFDLDRLPTNYGAPHKGKIDKIHLHIMGSRLMNAVIRKIRFGRAITSELMGQIKITTEMSLEIRSIAPRSAGSKSRLTATERFPARPSA